MNKNRMLVVLVVVLLLGGVIYQISLNRQAKSDSDQILLLLADTQKAVERNDARGAMAAVSRYYKDSSGITYPILRIRTADALTSGVQPDVVMDNQGIDVQGDAASVNLHVRVTDRRAANQVLVDHDFTLHLKKEKLRRYLIFTTRQWRITSVEGLGGVIESY